MNDNTYTIKLVNTGKPSQELLSEFNANTIQQAGKIVRKELRNCLDLPCKSTMERIVNNVMAFVWKGDRVQRTYYFCKGEIKTLYHG